MDEITARRVFFSGRVQGVWFRGHTCEIATRLGVTGWVRNRRDGRVEAIFVCTDKVMSQMIADARSGPRLARVDHVDVQALDIPNPVPVTFTQLPSI